MIAYDWWAYNFWRFVLVQEEVAKLAKTAIDYPPMQPGASKGTPAFDVNTLEKE